MFYPNGWHEDEEYLRTRIIEQMFITVNMDNGYLFKDEIQEAYFWDWEMGDFQAMTRGLKDVRF